MKRTALILISFLLFSNFLDAQNNSNKFNLIKKLQSDLIAKGRINDLNKEAKKIINQGLHKLNNKNTDDVLYKPISVLVNGNERYTYTYDVQGKIQSRLCENNETGDWTNVERITYTYNSQGDLLTNLYENWNGYWELKNRTAYIYDLQGNLLEENSQYYDFGFWVTKFQKAYTYDISGNKLSYLAKYWSDYFHSWITSESFVYTYDELGNLLTEENKIQCTLTSYTYNAMGQILTITEANLQNEVWIQKNQYTYTYNSMGQIVLIILANWQNGVWVQNDQTIYAFDDNGNLLTETTGTHYKKCTYDEQGNLLTKLNAYWNNAWLSYLNENLTTYTYDTQGNRLTEIREVWDVNTNTLINNFATCITYTYDQQGNMLTKIKGIWNEAWLSFLTNEQTTYTYDLYGNMLSELFEISYDFTNIAQKIFTTYTYDDYGNGASAESATWNHGVWTQGGKEIPLFYNNKKDSIFFPASSISAQYTTFTGVAKEPANVNSFILYQNYPNPFNPSTTISFTLPKKEFVKLIIYDILGKEIITLINEELPSGSHQIVWNPKKLSSGIYFYRLQSGKYSETRKMNLLK